LAESVRRAVGHGGRLSGSVVEEPTNWFQVMQDPEGNEFCFVQFK
jgi:predicted enzyme related to lactoylglutathione lyase